MIEEIKQDLLLRLKADGFRSVGEAVGSAHR
jgi:dihydroorotate dehydrogenase